jgi:hypothetical protein
MKIHVKANIDFACHIHGPTDYCNDLWFYCNNTRHHLSIHITPLHFLKTNRWDKLFLEFHDNAFP